MAIENPSLFKYEDLKNSLQYLKLDKLFGEVNALNKEMIGISTRVNVNQRDNVFINQEKYQSDIALVSNAFGVNELKFFFIKPLFVTRVKCVFLHEDMTLEVDGFRGDLIKYIVNDHYFSISSPVHAAETNSGFEYVYTIENILNGFILQPGVEITELEYVDISPKIINGILKRSANISHIIQDIIEVHSVVVSDLTKKLDSTNSEYKRILTAIDLSLAENERLEDSKTKSVELLTRVNNDIEQSHKKLKNIEDRILDLARREIEEKERLSLLTNEIETNASKSEECKLIISTAEDKLTSLNSKITEAERDLNLYTFDMQGFDKESKFQLKKYYISAGVLLLMLFVIFGFMYFNAKSFSDLMDTSWKISTWDILLSRLPLFTATALIIGTFSALLFFLVNHIIALNTDKMNMLKASILAEQITGTLGCEQSMTSEQIIELKRNTKIELLLKVFAPKESPKISNTTEQADVLAKLLDILKPKS